MHKVGSQRSGLGSLSWGEPVHEARQRLLLVMRRVPVCGGNRPRPVCPWGKRKRGINTHLSGLIFVGRDERSCLRGLHDSYGLKRFE